MNVDGWLNVMQIYSAISLCVLNLCKKKAQKLKTKKGTNEIVKRHYLLFSEFLFKKTQKIEIKFKPVKSHQFVTTKLCTILNSEWNYAYMCAQRSEQLLRGY